MKHGKTILGICLMAAVAMGLAASCWHNRKKQEPVLNLQPASASQDIGKLAYKHVKKLVDLGPRHTGSRGWYGSLAYIKQELNKAGLKPKRDRWTDPKEDLTFENIWATLPGKSKDVLLIACHHDTKNCTGHPDKDHNYHFVGANDSGSGVGLLLALAKELKTRKNVATIQLVFFDGEESVPYVWDIKRALFGSRRFVRRYLQQRMDMGGGPRIRGLILLDMVGATDLQIDDESQSDRRLHRVFRAAAKVCGHSRYFFQHRHEVTDDHVPFIVEAKIPAIDLIDLYDNPQWHTAQDTFANISPKSLQIVGEVVLTALPGVEQLLFPEHFKKPKKAPGKKR